MRRLYAILRKNIGPLFLLLTAMGLNGCTLPALEPRTQSVSLAPADAAQTRLGLALRERTQRHPELTGIYALYNPRDAFAARALLARTAERTLDVQYYIWKNDVTGTLLTEELINAAERNVRVRILLDDFGVSGIDNTLAQLNQHPNIEVRLFNPFVQRKFKVLGFITDFDRSNRRMHNKSFTVDNSATIIGGRNVGDEYFGATSGVLFDDLDVMAVGAVVDDVSRDFDRYWDSQSAYPLEHIIPIDPSHNAHSLRQSASAVERLPGAREYIAAIRELPFVRNLLNDELPMTWAKTRMVSDEPGKGLGLADRDDLLITKIVTLGGEAQQQFLLVSPYFVPTREGVRVLSDMMARGVEVKVLTNSLAATDVLPVHAGYAKRREALLKNGASLYETRRTQPKGSLQLRDLFGSSGSSLHAKTFAIDGERIFIGSFNFDPRSANYNTELGFIIESPLMAAQINQTFSRSIYDTSYKVTLDDSGELVWESHLNGAIDYYYTEPNTRWYTRALVTFFSWLPIEPLL